MRIAIAEDDKEIRTVFCGNLSDDVTDQLLFELFLQAGPIEHVSRPKDQNGRPRSFAFIVFKHECSVPYAINLFKETKLYSRKINLNSRSTLTHIPVLDTHLTEFTEPRGQQSNEPINYRESDYKNHHSERKGHRRDDSRYAHSNREHNSHQPTSWAELHALKGKGILSNDHYYDSLQRSSENKIKSYQKSGHPIVPAGTPNFNDLLQMGQQMVLPAIMGIPGMMPMFDMPPMGLGPNLGSDMFPSTHGKFSGGEHNSSDQDRGRRNDGRGSRRDHPYHDRWHSDHKRHDRGYSYSHSSHDRERRDRSSR